MYMCAACGASWALGISAAFISRVSNAAVRDRAHAEPLQRRVRRKQMKLFGHILRRPYDHPERLCIFEPNDDLEPRTAPDAVRRSGPPRTVGPRPLSPRLKDCLTETEPKLTTSHRIDRNGMKKLSAYVVFCAESSNWTSEILE